MLVNDEGHVGLWPWTLIYVITLIKMSIVGTKTDHKLSYNVSYYCWRLYIVGIWYFFLFIDYVSFLHIGWLVSHNTIVRRQWLDEWRACSFVIMLEVGQLLLVATVFGSLILSFWFLGCLIFCRNHLLFCSDVTLYFVLCNPLVMRVGKNSHGSRCKIKLALLEV